MPDYMMQDTGLPPYYPYPHFLVDMKLSHTAALTYTLLLDRAHLSQLNGWTDEDGRIYIIFPVESIAAVLNRGLTVTKSALAELAAVGLIERKRRGNFLPNRIYVKLPDGQKISPHLMDKNLSISGPEKRSEPFRKTGLSAVEKAATNQTSNNQTKRNQTRGSNSSRFPARYDRDYSVDPDDVV